METKQTAVDFAIEQLEKLIPYGNQMAIFAILKQAKQMEKEQMKDAFVGCWESNVPDGIECKLDAEQYYNETYGK